MKINYNTQRIDLDGSDFRRDISMENVDAKYLPFHSGSVLFQIPVFDMINSYADWKDLFFNDCKQFWNVYRDNEKCGTMFTHYNLDAYTFSEYDLEKVDGGFISKVTSWGWSKGDFIPADKVKVIEEQFKNCEGDTYTIYLVKANKVEVHHIFDNCILKEKVCWLYA